MGSPSKLRHPGPGNGDDLIAISKGEEKPLCIAVSRDDSISVDEVGAVTFYDRRAFRLREDVLERDAFDLFFDGTLGGDIANFGVVLERFNISDPVSRNVKQCGSYLSVPGIGSRSVLIDFFSDGLVLLFTLE